MRRVLTLLALLVLPGCGSAGLNAAAPPATEVRLELSPRADFQEKFQATLKTVGDGAVCRYDYQLAGDTHRDTVYLSRTQVHQVLQELGQAGALELEDGDCGDPEPEVLYTRLEIRCGSYTSTTRWRGLTETQGRVAAALLSSPLGPAIGEGLEAVRRRK